MACLFVYSVEICQLLDDGIVHEMEAAHQINILEAFLESALGILKTFLFND